VSLGSRLNWDRIPVFFSVLRGILKNPSKSW